MLRRSSETTPGQEAGIRALWAEGARRDDIAAAVGMTRDSFLIAQRRLELPPRPRSVGSGNRGVDPTGAEIRKPCAEIRGRWASEATTSSRSANPIGAASMEADRRILDPHLRPASNGDAGGRLSPTAGI